MLPPILLRTLFVVFLNYSQILFYRYLYINRVIIICWEFQFHFHAVVCELLMATSIKSLNFDVCQFSLAGLS